MLYCARTCRVVHQKNSRPNSFCVLENFQVLFFPYMHTALTKAGTRPRTRQSTVKRRSELTDVKVTMKRSFTTFVNLKLRLIRNFLKNSQTIFGSSEHYIKEYNIGYLHFGTSLQEWIPWLFLLMDLLKKEVKSPKTKFRKRFELGQSI
jgi:hypothetical protein